MAENELGENLIFVCGCGHSGTTLLWAMLSAHSRVHGIPYETNAFLNSKKNNMKHLSFIRKMLVASYYNLLNKQAQKKFIFFVRNGYFSFTRTDSDIVSFFKNQLEQAKKSNKIFVCEKTPRHILKIDRIKKIFPKSHIITLVRNGLDVTASLKERRGNFKNAMDRWINDNKTLLDFKSHYPSHMILYENLISKPEHELHEICRFCNLEYEETMMSYYDPSYSNKWNYDVRRQQLKEPIKDRRGRWKGILTDNEVSIFMEEAGDLMEYFGYETNL